MDGWDDPRMPTIFGLRRRGYTPASIRLFCERTAVSKSDSRIDYSLLEQAVRVAAWVDDGAAVYVCGSLQGMAGGVDAVLRQILGDEQVQAMLHDGRYRRDVY